MKSYKQLAAETRHKIIEKQRFGELKEWDCLVDSWLAFMERDHETPEDEKAEQYRDMVELLEKEIEKANPRRYWQLTVCHIETRQRLEAEYNESKSDDFSFSIGKDPETGFVRICPMNKENCIIIHGAEEAICFINHLLDCFQIA